MDEFLTDEEILELQRWCDEDEEAHIDSDMEVWLSNEIEVDDEFESDFTPSVETVRAAFNQQVRGIKKIELSDIQRRDMVDKLLILFNGKELPRGAQTELAAQFNVHRVTVWRIWSRALKQMKNKEVIKVDSLKKGRVGKKPKEWDMETLNALPIEKRTTLRAIAYALGIGFSTVYRLIKSGKLRAHSSSIKPSVSPKNKLMRLKYVLDQLIIPSTVHTLPKFSVMYNMVHIDGKWFYMSQKTQKFYLFPWETEPYRACQQKFQFILKVMFMGAVARQPFAPDGSLIWDGKIGMYPFTEVEYAQRTSKNRPTGTPEAKAVQSITKEVIREKLIKEVLPDIRAKWPSHYTKDIWIVQDNARPNIDGFNIRLTCQPALSPDLNVLDLSFFRGIQSIQYKEFPKTVDELVASVQNAFKAFDPRGLNFSWLQLQYCMVEVMSVKGGNNYKSAHKGKMKMDRLGTLPTQVEVPRELIIESRAYLEGGQSQATAPTHFAETNSDMNLPPEITT